MMTTPVDSSDDTAPPPDTDQYIYRPVTKVRSGEIVTEMTQIWISQP